jgi:hypothetical protein
VEEFEHPLRVTRRQNVRKHVDLHGFLSFGWLVSVQRSAAVRPPMPREGCLTRVAGVCDCRSRHPSGMTAIVGLVNPTGYNQRHGAAIANAAANQFAAGKPPELTRD